MEGLHGPNGMSVFGDRDRRARSARFCYCYCFVDKTCLFGLRCEYRVCVISVRVCFVLTPRGEHCLAIWHHYILN